MTLNANVRLAIMETQRAENVPIELDDLHSIY